MGGSEPQLERDAHEANARRECTRVGAFAAVRPTNFTVLFRPILQFCFVLEAGGGLLHLGQRRVSPH